MYLLLSQENIDTKASMRIGNHDKTLLKWAEEKFPEAAHL